MKYYSYKILIVIDYTGMRTCQETVALSYR